MKLSVIIPAFKDPLLNRTINSLLENSQLGSDLEIVPVFDGYSEELVEDPRVQPVYLSDNKGMRGAINAGIKKSIGEYIMKSDSHCLFSEGYDKQMLEDTKENWLMIPRRYSLDDTNHVRDLSRYYRDYHYLTFPEPHDNKYGMGLFVGEWHHLTNTRKHIEIDDTMSFQGSCWLAHKQYFLDHVGYMDDRIDTYGTFAGDQAEMGLNYWLKGGEVKINKKVWYAHLQKLRRHYESKMYSRTFKLDKNTIASHKWTAVHWMNNMEPNCIHDMKWFVDKFWPIPSWEDNWEEKWRSYGLSGN